MISTILRKKVNRVSGVGLIPFKVFGRLVVNLNLLMLLVLCSTEYSFAQYNNLKFDHITQSDGLPNSYVKSIIQDREGYMWFGTRSGLVKYDGYSIQVYDYDSNDSLSIKSNKVNVIFEDSRGYLWIGTNGGGLNIYDPITGVFSNYQQERKSSLNIFYDNIQTILEDSYGNVWIGYIGGGLSTFDPIKKEFKSYYSNIETSYTISSGTVFGIIEDDKGYVWFSSSFGLYKHDPISKKFEHYSMESEGLLSENNVFYAISKDKKGNIWLGTAASNVFKFDVEKEKFIQLNILFQDDIVWYKSEVITLFSDDDDNLWIGTWNGLIRYEKGGNKFTFFNHDENSPNSICDGSILNIYQDKSKLIWIGTADGGISKMDNRKNSFNHVSSTGRSSGGLSNKLVNSIVKQKSGVLWVGTTIGLNRLDPGEDKFKVYLPVDGDASSISSHAITEVFEDSGGTLWVGTGIAGLNRWDEKTNTFKVYTMDWNDSLSLSQNHVTDIEEDKSGNIWVATASHGMNILNPEEDNFIRYNNQLGDENSLCSDHLSTLYKDRDGNMWIGTIDGGLDKYNEKSNSFSHYGTTRQSDHGVLRGKSILSIYQDENRTFWVGTDYGLFKFIPSEGSFQSISKSDGLFATSIYGIIEDELNMLWLSTNLGLSKYNPATGTIFNYNAEDGLQSNEFRKGSYYKCNTGELYFGGDNGYNHFYPAEIKVNPFLPNVVITDFKVFGNSWKYKNRNRRENEIKLSYNDNFFSFHFAALDYSAPEKNKLAYMLEGVDRDWIHSKSESRARYTKIDPGNYLFKVKGSNNHGLWNEEVATLNVVITPPIWQSWWFKVLLLLAGISIISGYFLLRIHLVRKMNQNLKEQVNERTLALEDKNRLLAKKSSELGEINVLLEERQQHIEQQTEELRIQRDDLVNTNLVKDKLFSVIAHDLKGPFTTLLGFTDMLNSRYDKMENEKRKKIISSLKVSAGLLFSLVSGLLNWVRIQKGEILPIYVKRDIIQVLDTNIQIAEVQSKRKNIKIIRHYETDKIALNFDEEMINTVIRNLISNAIKFTPKHGEINVSCDKKENEIVIRVRDNGVGISKDRLQELLYEHKHITSYGTDNETGTGLGFEICKEFIFLHKGRISGTSREGEGSEFCFSLPIGMVAT